MAIAAGARADMTGLALTGAAVLSALYLVLWALARTIRIRRPRRPRPRRPRGRARISALYLLGFAVATGPPAAARERRGVLSHRIQGPSPAPPWSEPDEFSPPHPSGRAGVDAGPKTAHRAGGGPGAVRAPATAPPNARYRASSKRDDKVGISTRVPGPASKRRPHPDFMETYRVRPGDSLWSIASEWLAVDDPAHVARYWPRMYRANRSAIGPDPDLIRPGQVLAMPAPGGVAMSDR